MALRVARQALKDEDKVMDLMKRVLRLEALDGIRTNRLTAPEMSSGGPRGNQEHLDRMRDLGLLEGLRHWNGALVPTFRNPRNGKVIHQIDHLFVSSSSGGRLISCVTAENTRVFDRSFSDHLRIIAEFLEID